MSANVLSAGYLCARFGEVLFEFVLAIECECPVVISSCS